ncbi:hypothetical protein ACQEU6_31220 [Spirillospora sp. CA-108201]
MIAEMTPADWSSARRAAGGDMAGAGADPAAHERPGTEQRHDRPGDRSTDEGETPQATLLIVRLSGSGGR